MRGLCSLKYKPFCQKPYSENHWKKNLDNNKIVDAAFMDLSKAFHCITHDLLIAKMGVYGFSEGFLTISYSYLKCRKQSVNINNDHSMFQILLSSVHSRTTAFQRFYK